MTVPNGRSDRTFGFCFFPGNSPLYYHLECNYKTVTFAINNHQFPLNQYNKIHNALELAENTKCPYRQTIVKIDNGKEKIYHISYGYRKIKLPMHKDKQLYMLVVKGFGRKPMMLITTEPLSRNKEVLQRILESYLTRWKIEETIRFIKQEYDLENIRVLKYRRLKNMMAILLAVFYFIAVILDGTYKLRVITGSLLKEAKRVFGIPNFLYYALGDSLSAIFNRSPMKIRREKMPSTDQLNLNFNYP